ncbi:MAG: D-glucuronyl C5-epimerase family protein [Candidatus Hodarchaeota archaeon]
MNFAEDLTNGTSYSGTILGPYYEKLEDYKDPIFDDDGVLLIDFSKRKERGIKGIHYFPISITQFALRSHDLYLETKDKMYFKRFIDQCNWLVRSQVNDGKVQGVWFFNVGIGSFIKPPWISAMAQGQAISALLRAFIHTGNIVYLNTATKALTSFNILIQDGGVKHANKHGNIFYEEYPTTPPNHVLNGFIYSLLGIYDHYRVTKSKLSFELFTKGIDTLVRTIPNYDTGFWSKYSLSKKSNVGNHFNLASPVYHNIHINQLKILYRITQEKIFDYYAKKWQRYQQGPFGFLMAFVYTIFLNVVKVVKKLDLV